MRTVVVLPAPLGPSSANTSPASTVRSSPSSTLVAPYAFVSPRASIVYGIHISIWHTLTPMARGLTVEKVTAAAVALADEQGFAAVSMAKVAERLGFTTMSLYRHVSGKDELVQRMLGEALGMCPEFAIADWRSGLERWAREMLAKLHRHPWGIDVPITGMLGTPAQLSWLNRGLETLADTSLTEDQKAQMVLLVNGYVFWSARLAFQVPDDLEAPMVPPGFDLTPFPALARAFEANVFSDDSPMEELFEYGLQRVLDGIGAAMR